LIPQYFLPSLHVPKEPHVWRPRCKGSVRVRSRDFLTMTPSVESALPTCGLLEAGSFSTATTSSPRLENSFAEICASQMAGPSPESSAATEPDTSTDHLKESASVTGFPRLGSTRRSSSNSLSATPLPPASVLSAVLQTVSLSLATSVVPTDDSSPTVDGSLAATGYNGTSELLAGISSDPVTAPPSVLSTNSATQVENTKQSDASSPATPQELKQGEPSPLAPNSLGSEDIPARPSAARSASFSLTSAQSLQQESDTPSNKATSALTKPSQIRAPQVDVSSNASLLASAETIQPVSRATLDSITDPDVSSMPDPNGTLRTLNDGQPTPVNDEALVGSALESSKIQSATAAVLTDVQNQTDVAPDLAQDNSPANVATLPAQKPSADVPVVQLPLPSAPEQVPRSAPRQNSSSSTLSRADHSKALPTLGLNPASAPRDSGYPLPINAPAVSTEPISASGSAPNIGSTSKGHDSPGSNTSDKGAESSQRKDVSSSSQPSSPPLPVPAPTATSFSDPTGAVTTAPTSVMPHTTSEINPTSETLATPSNRSLIAEQTPVNAANPVHLAQMVSKAAQSEMRIGLTMPAFGSVEVRTVIHASDVGVLIGSEKGDLHSLLANDIPGITHALQQQNLRLTQVSFQQQGFAFSSDSSSGGQSQPRWFAPKTSSPQVTTAEPSASEVDLPAKQRSAASGLSILA